MKMKTRIERGCEILGLFIVETMNDFECVVTLLVRLLGLSVHDPSRVTVASSLPSYSFFSSLTRASMAIEKGRVFIVGVGCTAFTKVCSSLST